MNVLVTGATGLIGNAIVRRLKERGGRVRVLVRDPERAARVLPAGVEPVRGDVTVPDSLPAAMKDVEWLFHAAGMPEQWQPDASIFDRVNRQGTVNVLRAALAARVKRVVYTSTMDVFAAPRGGTLVETNIDTEPKPTAYERSKQDAEREAEAIRREGLELVYVNPGAVYGPSPVHVGLNSFFIQVLDRKVPALPPGGMPVAYVDGVADAHLAAAERGIPGERYLLADTHVSNAELAREILRVEGAGGRVPPTAPEALMKLLSAVSAPLARTFGFTPLIAPGQLSFLLWDARVDASKARRELGFTPSPLAEGVERTVTFLREEGLVRSVRQ
ncbi:NAD-dependent epimerase/dehydratase family protein [Archangium lipolyticum]|uniref:NAD-dependent epimerase/dehydratase family protein n=1 Tax=Archangium lipolyticum TaxID=2970465 RepID=UPI002149A03B|nr:NAD-dependent epimerase/dehydratase family protein [Archangium lipolyticum]